MDQAASTRTDVLALSGRAQNATERRLTQIGHRVVQADGVQHVECLESQLETPHLREPQFARQHHIDRPLRGTAEAAARRETHPAGRDLPRRIEHADQLGGGVGRKRLHRMDPRARPPVESPHADVDLDGMLKRSSDAIDFAVKNGLKCTYVTEDTTRSRPEVLAVLFRNAIEHGAHRLCLCDTVGHATPDGIRNLIGWTRNFIRSMGVEVGIDWHGHRDRDMGTINSLAALEAGARGYLTKPFSSMELLDRVEELLKQ